jgi:hypothetical protein
MATKITFPPLPPTATHTDIVRHYLRFRRAVIHAELEWFASRPTFDVLLDEAVHARDQWGKRLRHQRRLCKHVIPTAYQTLKSHRSALQRAPTFDGLFKLIDDALGPIPSSGDLYSYDTALRIGAFLRLYPTRVFLQTGALTGARNLSRAYSTRSIPLSQFPVQFHVLAPFEMENLLCCYKSNLRP